MPKKVSLLRSILTKVLICTGFLVFLTEGRAEVRQGSLKGFQWRTGQIISASQGDTFIFEAATSSRHGHVGIISVEDGNVFVYESYPGDVNGIRRTPLASFLERTHQNAQGHPEVSVSNFVRPLPDGDRDALVRILRDTQKAGIQYDDFHRGDNYLSDRPRTLDCSSYVAYAFRRLSQETKRPYQVGEVQKMRDLNLGAFGGSVARMEGIRFMERLNDPVLTPFSIVSSERLDVAFTNLPFDRTLTDSQFLEYYRPHLPAWQYRIYRRYLRAGPPNVGYPREWRHNAELERLNFAPPPERSYTAQENKVTEEALRGFAAHLQRPELERRKGEEAQEERIRHLTRQASQGNPFVLSALKDLLKSENPSVQDAAGSILAESRDLTHFRDWADVAIERLRNFDPGPPRNHKSLQVVKYLGWNGYERNFNLRLASLVGEETFNRVAREVVRAYRRLKTNDVRLFRANAGLSGWASDLIVSMGDFYSNESVDELIDLMRDPANSEDLRRQAGYALGRSNIPYALQRVQELRRTTPAGFLANQLREAEASLNRSIEQLQYWDAFAERVTTWDNRHLPDRTHR